MTYIEFFDKTATENICACLTYAPNRVIFVGDNAKLMKKHIANYQRVFDGRGETIEFECKTTPRNDLDAAVALLTELVETYEDCAFDVTGGDEMLLLALGVVYAQNLDKHIQIHKFNVKNNAIYDCDKDGNTIYRDTPTLSVEENVRIYGGDVVYGSIDDSKTYRWDLNEDFLQDIDFLWNVSKRDVLRWNRQIGIFAAMDAIGRKSEDGLNVTVSRHTLGLFLEQNHRHFHEYGDILDYLEDYGLLTTYHAEDAGDVIVSFKNEQVKKCLTKAGQALEMKVYAVARAVRDKEGNPVYGDVLNGVVIDWDGTCHDEQTEQVYDTENEMDVLMMHDMVPVFVSCKNGTFTAEELYKLNTVAERFGGPYAKKVLVASALDGMGDKGKFLRQRAKDMNIRVVDAVPEMDDAAWARQVKTFWSN